MAEQVTCLPSAESTRLSARHVAGVIPAGDVHPATHTPSLASAWLHVHSQESVPEVHVQVLPLIAAKTWTCPGAGQVAASTCVDASGVETPESGPRGPVPSSPQPAATRMATPRATKKRVLIAPSFLSPSGRRGLLGGGIASQMDN